MFSKQSNLSPEATMNTYEPFHISQIHHIRRLTENDIPCILSLCQSNQLYYQYYPPIATACSILQDLHALPPNKTSQDKYFMGYFDAADRLVAVLDLILGYPNDQTAFIGFFMTDVSFQGQGVGSEIIEHLCTALRQHGYQTIRLGWVQGNPQSEHFWRKNHFSVIGSSSNRAGPTITLAERDL